MSLNLLELSDNSKETAAAQASSETSLMPSLSERQEFINMSLSANKSFRGEQNTDTLICSNPFLPDGSHIQSNAQRSGNHLPDGTHFQPHAQRPGNHLPDGTHIQPHAQQPGNRLPDGTHIQPHAPRF